MKPAAVEIQGYPGRRLPLEDLPAVLDFLLSD